MADGEGLLAAQQAAAVRIPYENIGVNQNAFTGALNAFHIVSQVNAQRQKLEESLHDEQLKMTLGEQAHQLKVDQMNQNAVLAMQRMNMNQVLSDARLTVAQQNANTMRDRVDSIVDQRTKTNEDVGRFYDDIRHLDAKPGDPDFPTKYAGILAQNSMAGRDPGVRQYMKQFGDQHNYSAAKQVQQVNADQATLDHELAANHLNTTMLDNFQAQIKRNAQNQPLDKQGNVIAQDAQGNLLPKPGQKTVPTGNLFVQLPLDPRLPTNQAPRYKTIPQPQVTEWMQRRSGIQQRRAQLPGQLNDPDLGVQPVPVPSNPVVPTPNVSNGVPQVGEIKKGYRFSGGDPSDKNNWEPAQ